MRITQPSRPLRVKHKTRAYYVLPIDRGHYDRLLADGAWDLMGEDFAYLVDTATHLWHYADEGRWDEAIAEFYDWILTGLDMEDGVLEAENFEVRFQRCATAVREIVDLITPIMKHAFVERQGFASFDDFVGTSALVICVYYE